MDSPDIPEAVVRSSADFDALMGQLLFAAHRNGVDVAGSWVFRNGDSVPDWEIQVHELETE